MKLKSIMETLEFRLQFHASPVPKESLDKLVISLIPNDTLRATGKSTEGNARNGSCYWRKALIESIKVVQDPLSKEFEKKMYRLVVSMDSLSSDILGEATINLTEFINSIKPESVALPLKNCSTGTVLHVEVQCLTQRTASRANEEIRDEEDQVFSNENELIPELSGSMTPRSVRLSALQSLVKPWISSGRIMHTAATSDSSGSSESSSPRSYTSDDVIANDPLSRMNCGTLRQDSSGSHAGSCKSTFHSQILKDHDAVGYIVDGCYDTFSCQVDSINTPPESGRDSLSLVENCALGSLDGSQEERNHACTKLETTEVTKTKLQADALKWERLADDLKGEMEANKEQVATTKMNGMDFTVTISTLEVECDKPRSEEKQARLEAHEWEIGDSYGRWGEETSAKQIIKELQKEIAYEKEANQNLTLQLCKYKDSNTELVSVIAQLEESLEERTQEIERLTQLAFNKEGINTRHEQMDIYKVFKEREVKLLLDFKEKEFELQKRIECLEISNEQLASCPSDSGVDQLQMELVRLHKENSSLSRREQELLSKLNIQDVLQEEVQRLQEANEQLQLCLSKVSETGKDPHLLERCVTLETKLEEVLEANNMYKQQLSSILEKQQNVNLAALDGFGDSDQVVKEILELRTKSALAEAELQEMQQRYAFMSIRCAEIDAERSRLMMVVKNLKNGR